jgi:hypothetical protein
VILLSSEERLPDTNEVLLQGQIVNLYETANVTLVTLRVISQGEREEYIFYPRTVFFDPLRDDCRQYAVRDRVQIHGYVSQSRPSNDRVYPQSLIGRSITPAVDGMQSAFGLTGDAVMGTFPIDYDQFKMVGTVNDVHVGTKNNISFTLSMNTDGRKRFVPLVMFQTETFNPLPLLVPGKRLAVVGHYRTTKQRNSRGKMASLESAVACAIAEA